MATLLSISSGNLSSASSWGVVEPTSFQGTPNATLTATINISTLIVGSSFVLASAINVTGVALQISGRVATATGTLNVQLYDVTGATIIGQVTINIADLPNSNIVGANHIDWTYFKFSSPVTTVAGRTYAIRTQSSATAQFSWYYTTTTTNPNRALVTTTNQAPTAADALIITGQYTAASANSPVTITMDLSSIALGNVWVSSLGTLAHSTSMSTSLTMNGYIVVGVGGTYLIGTSISSIPSPYTVTVTMNCTTALQYPIWVYGTMKTYGATKTIATKLAADVSIGATSSTTSTETGWKSGDVIAIPSTTRTYSQYETETLSTDASATTLNHTAYNYAHGGNATTKVQADIVNLTRNIVITGAGVLLANKTNIQMFAVSVTSFYYTQFRYLGTGTTNVNSGICVNTLTSGFGTFEMQYCSMIDGTQALANTANTGLQSVSNNTGTTISNNIFYGLGWTTTVTATLILNVFNDGNYVIGCMHTSNALQSTYMGSNNVIASNAVVGASTGFFNNATNNSFYSNGTWGLIMGQPNILGNKNLSNFRIWRNFYGISFTTSSGGYSREDYVSFDGLQCFGNQSVSFLAGNSMYERIYVSNSFFYGGTTFVQPAHYSGSTIPLDSVFYDNCYFGYSDTSFTPSPFNNAVLTGANSSTAMVFSNCYFNGVEATLPSQGFPQTVLSGSYISLNHNKVSNSNKQWMPNGVLSTDTTIFNLTSRSLRLTPNLAAYKLTSSIVRVPVKSGNTCAINVKVRKSTALGTGTVYNGNQPRLMYAFNPVLGNLTETVGNTFYNLNLIYIAQQDFNNAAYWAKTATTTTINQINSPDNRLTATKVIVNNGVTFTNTTTNLLGTSNTYVIGDIYTSSIYAKKGEFDAITLIQGVSSSLGSAALVKVNLNNGAVISSSGAYGSPGYSVTDVGNGWYRITLTKQIITQATNNRHAIVPESTTATAGDGTSGIYIWGAQVVQGTDPGLYTPSEDWQTLSYTTPAFSSDGVAEFYVDCDGTAGWINIDDWSTTTSNDTRGTDFWGNTGTYIETDWKKPGGSYTFVS
jgi:hypothetical protein